jgi:hypothetical protein
VPSSPEGLLKRTQYVLPVQGKIVVIHISLFERGDDEFERLKIFLKKRNEWLDFIATQLSFHR